MRRRPRLTAAVYAGRPSGEVEIEDVHARVAEHAERAPIGVVVDQPVDDLDRQGSGGGDPRRLEAGVGDRDVGVETGRRRGHGVDRHLDIVRQPVASRGRRPPARSTAARSSALSGSQVGARAGQAVVPVAGRRGTGLEPLVTVERLTDQGRPDDLTVAFHQGTVGLVTERHLGDTGDDERVGETGEGGHHGQHEQAGTKLTRHQKTPSAVMAMSMALMPTKGATRPPTP